VEKDKEKVKCSFCGRTKKETNVLISGLNGYICDICVEQATHIVTEELAQSGVKPKGTATPAAQQKAFEHTLLKPEEIKLHLDEYVIGQEEAKKSTIGSGIQPLQTHWPASYCREY
jgi:ATP-dependent Clp protease ATP-binding subunit ClpX